MGTDLDLAAYAPLLTADPGHLGNREMSEEMRVLLTEEGIEVINAEAIVARYPARLAGGWPLKPYAVAQSRFREVLYFDADTVPLVDPKTAFEWSHFRDNGLTSWLLLKIYSGYCEYATLTQANDGSWRGTTGAAGSDIRLRELRPGSLEVENHGAHVSAENLVGALVNPTLFAAGYDRKRAAALGSALSLMYDDIPDQIERHAAMHRPPTSWRGFLDQLAATLESARQKRSSLVGQRKMISRAQADSLYTSCLNIGFNSMLHRSKGGRLLMFAPVVPSDCGNGLAIRAGFFLDTYSRCFDVDLVVVPLSGSTGSTEFARSRATRVEVVGIYHADSHYRLVTSVRETSERLNAFRRYGQPSLSAFVSPAWRSLQDLLGCETYDVVHVFRLYLAALATPWIAKARGHTRLVIDCDVNDAAAYRSIAAMHRGQQNYEAADWADAEAVAFAHFATRWLPKFDLAFAASRQEVKTLANIGVRTEVVPNVAPAPMAAPSRRVKRPPTVLFVGTLGYAPNADAIIWFVSHVWRQLQRALHDRLRLIIVGSNPPTRLARLASQRGIEVTGAVDDVTTGTPI